MSKKVTVQKTVSVFSVLTAEREVTMVVLFVVGVGGLHDAVIASGEMLVQTD